MAFEKMTADALYDEFVAIFPDALEHGEQGNVVTKYDKIGARMLRIEFSDAPTLYFLWYDENNWNLGTKMYRQKPKKQQEKESGQDDAVKNAVVFLLKNELEKCHVTPGNINSIDIFNDLKNKLENLSAKPVVSDLITNGNDPITGCNQEWVKEFPDDVPERKYQETSFA